METKTHPFVEYLETLRTRDDRGALAALRRGLGEAPGTVPAMYPYVVRHLPAGVKPWEEDTYYTVAALFAYHAQEGGTGNIGSSFAQVRREAGRKNPNADHTALERRFTALLAAHPDDLPFYLRQAVSFLKANSVPINWHQLFYDMRAWGHPNRYVQKQWAQGFWGRQKREKEEE
jgi:CRISPR system Cascade subunit CasB